MLFSSQPLCFNVFQVCLDLGCSLLHWVELELVINFQPARHVTAMHPLVKEFYKTHCTPAPDNLNCCTVERCDENLFLLHSLAEESESDSSGDSNEDSSDDYDSDADEEFINTLQNQEPSLRLSIDDMDTRRDYKSIIFLQDIIDCVVIKCDMFWNSTTKLKSSAKFTKFCKCWHKFNITDAGKLHRELGSGVADNVFMDLLKDIRDPLYVE